MRRRPTAVDVTQLIPAELYYGIAGDAFRYFGANDPRSVEESGRHHRWTAAVLEAGYTVRGIREAAKSDAGYQKWHAFQQRKARVISQDPGPVRRRSAGGGT